MPTLEEWTGHRWDELHWIDPLCGEKCLPDVVSSDVLVWASHTLMPLLAARCAKLNTHVAHACAFQRPLDPLVPRSELPPPLIIFNLWWSKVGDDGDVNVIINPSDGETVEGKSEDLVNIESYIYEIALHEALHALWGAVHTSTNKGLMCSPTSLLDGYSTDENSCGSTPEDEWLLRLDSRDIAMYSLYGNPALKHGMGKAEVEAIVRVLP